VRLADLVNSVGSNFREVANFIRYPFQNLSRIATRHAQQEYENVELPWGKKTETRGNSVEQSNLPVEQRNSQADRRLNPYSPQELFNESNARTSQVKVASSSLSEIANAVTIATADRLARKTSRSAKTLPILPTDIEIRGGRRGKYRVEKCLKDGETVRLYQGIQVENNKPILIKEYLLTDRDFNLKEAKERKEKFEKLASLNLKNGVGQDFRLISPWDAIAPSNEKRCYLIFEQPIHNSLTLREYLLKSGAMTPHQVRGVLDQVLQTLWFLHSYRLRTFDDELEQGLPHGYLSLDSLLIASSSQLSALDQPQFFIYVADLALWEDLFKPPTAKFSYRSPKQDLIDLGYVSFYLLWGTTVDPDTTQPLNPKFEQHWPEFKDARLNKFIHRLLGIDEPFKTAFEARKELLAPLSMELETPLDVTAEADSLEEDTQRYSLFRLVLTIIIFGLLAGLLWQIMLRLRQPLAQVEGLVFNSSEPCCLAQIDQVPTGTATYITEADGIWSYILNTVSLVSYNKTFVEELTIRDPRLKTYTLNISNENIIEAIRLKRADFALTTFIEDLPDDMEQVEIAYDGLVVFVAFSDNKRHQSVPNALNGKITLDQLREIYTTETLTNWSPPEGISQNINVYMPVDNRQAVKFFEELVFKGDPPQEFKNLPEKLIREAQKKIINQQPINESYILGEILKDFEQKQTVGFGFGLLSRVFNQCAVYPLALGKKGEEVQPLVQQLGNQVKPIEPTIDLCNDKGSYWPNVEAFKSGSYPLIYRLVVVYPKKDKTQAVAGKKFAELLKTDEGQRLLSEAGLVSLRTLPKRN